MIDFTSALYLGFRHLRDELPTWSSLSTGRPAALGGEDISRQTAAEFAALTGAESAVLGPSSLHLFSDLCIWLGGRGATFLIDQRAYPIAQWAVARERFAPFAHYDLNHLENRLRRGRRGRPVVVADAYCPRCGRHAPIQDMQQLIRPLGGLLLLDDTQGLGIFGDSPRPWMRWGKGGGGSLRFQSITSKEDVLVISSLAKAFGVPIAVLQGPAELTSAAMNAGLSWTHCSPPAIPLVMAAANAIRRNHHEGDALRSKLLALLAPMRRFLAGAGVESPLFPVLSLGGIDALAAHARLRSAGIETFVNDPSRLSFVITADHSPDQLRELVRELYYVLEDSCPAL